MQQNIPSHIGIIMDGNRRWAKQHGKSTIEGHRAGYKTFKKIAESVLDKGVNELSVYVFSTENWSRAQEEVEGLMGILRWAFKHDLEELHEKNVKVRVSGLRENVPADILKDIDELTETTKNNTRGTLNLCFNYGGRADIVQAAKKLAAAGDDITEETFARALSTAGMSDVDLIIRTSENRLSNFLPWESVYAEIYFVPDLFWPDFDEAELDKALAFYADRQRRFGG